jgi:transposase
MARKRRAFSVEFKQEAVRRVQERTALGVPLTQIGREVGVRPDMLRRWKREFGARPVKPGGEEVVSAAEVRQLRRELEAVRQERDFLKKAAAFFAKESR